MRDVSVAGLLLLAACSSKPAERTPQAARAEAGVDAEPNAIAPPAVSPAPAPGDDYRAVAQAAESFARDFVERNRREESAIGTEDGPPQTLIVYCALDSAVSEIASLSIAELEREQLARHVAVMREDLRLSGYPEEMWRDPIDRFEAGRLALIAKIDPALHTSGDDGDDGGAHIADDPSYKPFADSAEGAIERLADTLNRRRVALSPDLPPISTDAGCGAAEQPYRVASEPAGGRVWLQTKFYADVCQARGQNAWNRETCRWSEIDPRQTRYLSGNYVYLAFWPDGRHGHGSMSFEGGGDGDDTPETRVVRPD